MEERLQKILAKAGVASRRHSEELILEGKVKVNGKIVTELGTKVNVSKDKIEVAGKPLPPLEQKVYYLLNKPRGYVTTLNDERGRKTVIELLEGIEKRVYPVGRLDYDSEGLLLLTNDGELTQALTHPKHKVKKTYLARINGIPRADQLEEMAKGIRLEDGLTAPADVKLVSINDNRALLEISIHEGRNRQVRRMCEHIGYDVLRLRRVRMGPIELGDLKPGQFRPLNRIELAALSSMVGLSLKYTASTTASVGERKGQSSKTNVRGALFSRQNHNKESKTADKKSRGISGQTSRMDKKFGKPLEKPTDSKDISSTNNRKSFGNKTTKTSQKPVTRAAGSKYGKASGTFKGGKSFSRGKVK